MRSATRLLLLSFIAASFLSFAFLVAPSVAAAAPQYASYSVTGSREGRSFSAIVNETVSPSSATGISDVTLQIISGSGNLSYSKLMNSSQILLPYFPTISNQSFTYEFHNFSISATITQAGLGSVVYNGNTYTLSNYSFSLTVSGRSQMEAVGSASVFPSGLVYSASLVANGTDSLSVRLLGTDLSLNPQSNSSSQTNTSIAVAGGTASILVGIGAFVVHRRTKNTPRTEGSGEKPLYHVD